MKQFLVFAYDEDGRGVDNQGVGGWLSFKSDHDSLEEAKETLKARLEDEDEGNADGHVVDVATGKCWQIKELFDGKEWQHVDGQWQWMTDAEYAEARKKEMAKYLERIEKARSARGGGGR